MTDVQLILFAALAIIVGVLLIAVLLAPLIVHLQWERRRKRGWR